MLTTPASRFVMLSFLIAFAQIKAEDIPEGVMPKRAVVGTGVSTSDTPTPTSTPSTSQAVSPTTTTPTSNAGSTSTPGTSTPATTPASSTADTSSTDGASSAASSASQQSSQQSTSVPTTIAVTTTNSDGSTLTSHIATSTLASATSSGAVRTETGSNGHSVVKIGSSTIDPSTLSHKTTITSALLGKETHQSVYTSFWTSDGQTYSSLVTTDAVVTGTTGYATATIAPSLANGGGDGTNLSTNTKKVIGGVVGGIGGAILIGGLAFVAWRLWGTKKQSAQGDEFLDSQNDSIRQEKRDTAGSYGSGLDRYANPNGAVNTASNF